MKSSRSKSIKKIWISDESGRSFFGWKIKEEIFAIFFILVILSLANDKNIVDKVSSNTHIQIFVGLIFIYCIYNRIPWSLAFIILILISILFSDFLKNIKESVKKIFEDVKENNNYQDSDTKQNNYVNKSVMQLGARVFNWMSKDQKEPNDQKERKEFKEYKGILKKKVRFKKDIKKKDQVLNENEPIESSSDEDEDEECKRVSKILGFSDGEEGGFSEAETDTETDGDVDYSENLKDSLKSFMKEKL